MNISQNPKSSGRKLKVELNLSIYAIKADLKNESVVNTSKFPRKVYLLSLESNVDELNIDKLKKY